MTVPDNIRRRAYRWLTQDALVDFLIERNVPEAVIQEDVKYENYSNFPWVELKIKNRRLKIAKLL